MHSWCIPIASVEYASKSAQSEAVLVMPAVQVLLTVNQ